MNLVIWMLAGGLLGWLAFSFLGVNVARGRFLSTLIGAFGGALGGREVAPIFASPVAGEFSMTAMFFALAVAAIFLVLSQLMSSHLDL
jgi:uncharacterized membrane protein YeaQ/YmgE (transglycosylase-associated protein family)